MRKVIILFTGLLFLVACGSEEIHESVDENIANDTREVMELVESNIDVPFEELEDSDKETLNSYDEKYDKVLDYDDPDKSILLLGLNTVDTYKEGIELDSDYETIEKNKEYAERLIQTGDISE